MILADTSIWIRYLRRRDEQIAERFEGLLRSQEISLCGPVIAELLAGAKSPDRLQELLHGLVYRGTFATTWTLAGVLISRCRVDGKTVKLSDAAIAAAAIERSDRVWTTDGDFLVLAKADPRLSVDHEQSLG